MKHKHRITVTRPPSGGGTQVDGEWVPAGPNTIVLNQVLCDMQEAGMRFPRDADGAPIYEADAAAFLKDKLHATLVQVDDFASIDYPADKFHPAGRRKESQITHVSELDGSLFLKFVVRR